MHTNLSLRLLPSCSGLGCSGWRGLASHQGAAACVHAREVAAGIQSASAVRSEEQAGLQVPSLTFA